MRRFLHHVATTLLAVLVLLTATRSATGELRMSSNPADLFIKVSKGKSTGYSGTDYDDKEQTLSFEVEIRNQEIYRDFKNLTATLMIIGESAAVKLYHLLGRSASTFDLPSRGSHTFDAKPIQLSFDDHLYAKHGVKFYGYVVLVQDENSEVLASKVLKSSLLDYAEVLLRMSEGAQFVPSELEERKRELARQDREKGSDAGSTASSTAHDGEQRVVILHKTINVYSSKPPHPRVGMLNKGAEITVLGRASPTLYRIRFSSGDRVLEARARVADIP